MRVAYIIQTHQGESQIYNLIKVIKKASPQSFILILHNPIYFQVNQKIKRMYDDIHVINLPVFLGGFSILNNFFTGMGWLLKNRIEFDWLINLSGQDYPTQPLSKIERFLGQTKYDAFLEHFDIFSSACPWNGKLGYERYFYQYWRSPGYLSKWQKATIKPIKFLVNNFQSFVRIETSYALMVGVRSNRHPFQNKNVTCYGGSFAMTLSKKCIEFLYQWYNVNQDNELLNHYRKTVLPDESLIQTVLVNSGFFDLCNKNHRYSDYTNSRCGHPRILNSQDYPLLINDDIHFARKFDINQDPQILALLDQRIFSKDLQVSIPC